MHNNFSVMYLIISLLFLNYSTVSSQTIVDKEIVSGKWTRKMSPYIITRDIVLPYGSGLSIEPGVRVEFAGYFSFSVKGAIMAIGTPQDSIYFTTAKENKYWKGIKISRNYIQMDNDSVFFAYTHFSNALNTDSIDEEFKEQENGSVFHTFNFNYLSLHFCTFENNASYGDGGVIYMNNGGERAIIENCIFRNNFSLGSGGAIALKKTFCKLTLNQFLQNKAGNSGGAIFTSRDKNRIEYNLFRENEAEDNGGALMVDFESQVYVANNIFQVNKAQKNGGAIQTGSNSSAKIEKNKFNGNSAAMYGGAINVDDFGFPLHIFNNLIYQNSARFGGAISLFNTSVYVYGNTIVKNNAVAGSAVFMAAQAPVSFSGNILFYNQSPDSVQILVKAGSFPPNIEFSCIQNGVNSVKLAAQDEEIKSYWIDIIDSEPLFENLFALDFRLQEFSPCIDTWLLEDENLILPEFDLNGEQRVQNFYPDMGAYEFTLDF